jgi:hypothetical protein
LFKMNSVIDVFFEKWFLVSSLTVAFFQIFLHDVLLLTSGK